MDFHELSRLINRSLPGAGVWAQSASDEYALDGGSEGLAIRRESGPSASWWLVVFFRVAPGSPEAGAEGSDGWEVEVGYTSDHDTLVGAKAEARELLKHLPRMDFSDEDLTQDFIFAVLEDPEDADR